VQLEPFVQLNNNCFVHSANAFGATRALSRGAADFEGNVAELLARLSTRRRWTAN